MLMTQNAEEQRQALQKYTYRPDRTSRAGQTRSSDWPWTKKIRRAIQVLQRRTKKQSGANW